MYNFLERNKANNKKDIVLMNLLFSIYSVLECCDCCISAGEIIREIQVALQNRTTMWHYSALFGKMSTEINYVKTRLLNRVVYVIVRYVSIRKQMYLNLVTNN